MLAQDDGGRAERARATPIESVLERRHIHLRKSGAERIGACPKCGGTDRFAINTAKNTWNCRQCKAGYPNIAGDVIGLVMWLDGVDFPGALDILDGPAPGRSPNGHDKDPPAKLGPIVAFYDYLDEMENLLFQVTRHDQPEKTFRQRKPDGQGGWIGNTAGVRMVPYHLPEVLAAVDQHYIIWIAEGEKDVDNLRRLGLIATCNPRGAGKWGACKIDEYFHGAHVVIVADVDPQSSNKKTGEKLTHPDGRPRFVGWDHAHDVARHLFEVAEDVRVIDLTAVWAQCPDKCDISDWIAKGVTREALDQIADEATQWQPGDEISLPASVAPLKPVGIALTSRQFIAGFVPPEYLVQGLLQRRYIYSFTGSTGSGKTAITLLLTLCVSQGMSFAGMEVERGSVLYFAGENPDDVRGRWLATCQNNGVHHDDIDNVWFVAGVYKFSEIGERIRQEMAANTKLSLVVVDTSAVYFEGEEENSNTQLGAHARRMRLIFVAMVGGPTVVINCHPPKNAGPDNLVPRGGGAFVAEMDGNLTARMVDSAIVVYWQQKFRGPDFSPLDFMVKTVTHEMLKDSKGRLIPTVIAVPIGEQMAEAIKRRDRADQDAILWSVRQNPRLSQADRARELNWVNQLGQPNKGKVNRHLQGLQRAGLLDKDYKGEYDLTKKGTEAAKKLKDWVEEGDAVDEG